MDWIAEIGINFSGSFEKAKEMVIFSHRAGATHVKMQKYDPIKLLGPTSPYLNDAHQLEWSELKELSQLTRSLGMKFGCSVFDCRDIDKVYDMSDFMKIATRMNKSAEFISVVDQTKLPTYMSVQPEHSIRIPDRFKLMWCVAKYPSTKEEIAGYPYNANFGLSSHCPDISATLDAVKQGARVVEHHVCMSKQEKGCDIPASISFGEFSELINKANDFLR